MFDFSSNSETHCWWKSYPENSKNMLPCPKTKKHIFHQTMTYRYTFFWPMISWLPQVENLWTASTFFVALTLCTFTKLDHNVGSLGIGPFFHRHLSHNISLALLGIGQILQRSTSRFSWGLMSREHPWNPSVADTQFPAFLHVLSANKAPLLFEEARTDSQISRDVKSTLSWNVQVWRTESWKKRSYVYCVLGCCRCGLSFLP